MRSHHNEGSKLSADQVLVSIHWLLLMKKLRRQLSLQTMILHLCKSMKTSHMFPEDHTCYVGDKIIPPFIKSFPSGGITLQILSDMMQ